MQPLSCSHRTSSAPGAVVSEPAPRATSAGHSVGVLPTISAFLSSLSPAYVPESMQRATSSAVPSKADTNKVAHDALHKLKLACNVASCWLPSVRVVSDAVATVCSSFSLASQLGNVLDNSQRCAGAAFALVALDSLPTGASVPATGQRGSPQNPIPVPDSETLSKIGRDGNYPTDACYKQNQSFSHNSTEPIAAFRGDYDGGCHTITDLNTCLFSELDRYAVVRNLNLANATIDGDQMRLGALACELAPFTRVEDVRAEHIAIHNHHSGMFLDFATTGVITGYQSKASNVSGIDINNCSVSTSGNFSVGGVVAAQVIGRQENINITNSRAVTQGRESHSGIGAGELHGDIQRMLITDSQASTSGRLAHAGIGAGKVGSNGRLSDFGAASCRASTQGDGSRVGIGAGLAEGALDRLTLANCQGESSGKNAFAGLGAGQVGRQNFREQARIDNTVLVDSRAQTTGPGASAGVAVGALYGQASNIVSARCQVRTEARNANASSGAGFSRVQISGLSSLNSTAEAREGIVVDDKPTDVGSLNQSQLCHGADARLVLSNCTVIPLVTTPANCSSTPLDVEYGSLWRPIEINDIETLNSIGLQGYFPSDAHYIQTADLDGRTLNSNGSAIFTGHYDGQNHVIHHQQACLFRDLRGTVRNLNLVDANITAHDQPTGVVACTMDDVGGIEDIRIDRCHVFTQGKAMAGAVSGERLGLYNLVGRAEIHNATVETTGEGAEAGGVAGRCHGITDQIVINNTRVITHGKDALAAAGGGRVAGKFGYLVSTCNDIKTFGNGARAGLGAGIISSGLLGPITGVNSTVSTEGPEASGGVGAGAVGLNGRLKGVTSLHCHIFTNGKEAHAGVGAGVIGFFGGAAEITAVNSHLVTEGRQAHTGIGAGVTASYAFLRNGTSVNSTMSALGADSHARLGTNTLDGEPFELASIKGVGTQINGQLYYDNNVNLSSLCAESDPQFIQPDCQPESMVTICPMPPLALTALATPVPAATFTTTLATAVGIAVGSVIVFGMSALAASYYMRHRGPARAQQD